MRTATSGSFEPKAVSRQRLSRRLIAPFLLVALRMLALIVAVFTFSAAYSASAVRILPPH